MPNNTKSIYTNYENDTTKLKEIENKLKELEKLTPEEQNKLYFKQVISEEIWKKKYKTESDKSIVDTWKRIAKFLSKNEENKDIWYLYFFDLLEEFKFLPGGRIIYASDPNKKKVTSFNCFVGGIIEDSIEGIMKELSNSVFISKAGGGYGVNFSTLRPRGAKIHTTNGVSSGVISFMHIWNEAAKQIKNGGNRRSALLSLLDVDHPEIEDYIFAKDMVGFDVPLGFFNMSVGIVDGFMDAVINDKDWKLKFNGKVYKVVKARELFDKIVKKAIMGEPGLIFLDNANKYYNLYYLPDQRIYACNGCSEVLLPPFGSCLLGSLNLTHFIHGIPFENATFNFELLNLYLPLALRMLDNTIDLSEYPLPEQKEMEQAYRHVGLGFTGLGDVLTLLKIKYGSDKAIQWSNNFMKTFTNMLYQASSYLAIERGDFHRLDRDKFLNGKFVSALNEDTKNLIRTNGIHNATLVAVAPTGTISILANNVSSGIEPIFANSYARKMRTDSGYIEQTVMDYAYQLWLEKYNDKPLPEYWITATELTPTEHIDMLISIQQWNDKSTSKCIAKETRIVTDKGIFKIEDLTDIKEPIPDTFYKPNDEYYVIDEYGQKQKIKSVYYNGKSEGLKITFNNGFSITTSVNHKFKTPNGWKSAKELKINDMTLYRKTKMDNNTKYQKINTPFIPGASTKKLKLPTILDGDFGLFIGMYLVNGSSSRNNVVIQTKNKDTVKLIKDLFLKLFGIYKVHMENEIISIILESKEFKRFLDMWIGDIDKQIPEEIFRSPDRVKLSFLSGVFLNKHINKENDLVVYGEYSKNIAEGCTYLLNSLGYQYYLDNHSNMFYVATDLDANRIDSSDRYKQQYTQNKDSNIAMNQIVNIEYVNEVDLYDIEVENTHSYLINGFISHNTVNLPKDFSVEELKDLYIKAWRNGIKGITVFKPNENSEVVLETKDDTNKNNNKETKPEISKKKKRDFMLSGKTYKLRSPKEKYSYYITINNFIDDSGKLRPFEIFINTKDPRQPIFAFISRLLSALFRREENLDFIIKEMQTTLVHGEGFFDPKDGKHVPSLIAYIGKTIKQHIESLKNNKSDNNIENLNSGIVTNVIMPEFKENISNEKNFPEDNTVFEICPECGMKGLKIENGCKTCIYCGYSGCE